MIVAIGRRDADRLPTRRLLDVDIEMIFARSIRRERDQPAVGRDRRIRRQPFVIREPRHDVIIGRRLARRVDKIR